MVCFLRGAKCTCLFLGGCEEECPPPPPLGSVVLYHVSTCLTGRIQPLCVKVGEQLLLAQKMAKDVLSSDHEKLQRAVYIALLQIWLLAQLGPCLVGKAPRGKWAGKSLSHSGCRGLYRAGSCGCPWSRQCQASEDLPVGGLCRAYSH